MRRLSRAEIEMLVGREHPNQTPVGGSVGRTRGSSPAGIQPVRCCTHTIGRGRAPAPPPRRPVRVPPGRSEHCDPALYPPVPCRSSRAPCLCVFLSADEVREASIVSTVCSADLRNHVRPAAGRDSHFRNRKSKTPPCKRARRCSVPARGCRMSYPNGPGGRTVGRTRLLRPLPASSGLDGLYCRRREQRRQLKTFVEDIVRRRTVGGQWFERSVCHRTDKMPATFFRLKKH